MAWDVVAAVLALLALAPRWHGDPRATAIAGYASAACSWMAARRSRA